MFFAFSVDNVISEKSMKLKENKKRQDTLPFFTRRKRREFDDFLGFFAGSENPSVRGALCTFEITLSQAITLTLLLVCAFSPRVHSNPAGSPLTDFRVLQKRRKGANYRRFYRIQNNVRRSVKRREIDEVTRNKKPQDARCTCRT